MPKLSIIIPVYNVEAYLRACLDSVLDEQQTDYEVLIINDGSTDSSPQIVAEYVEMQPERFRLVTTENGGLGHARNTGLALASGDYVLFLDSDDSLSPGAVGEILSQCEADFDICFFDFLTVNESGRELARTKGCGKTDTFTLADYPELLFDPPNAWNKLWRRSLFLDNGIVFPDRLWFEDLATSPRLYLRADKLCAVDRAWYRYLLRQGSITNNKNPTRNLDMITALDQTLEDYRQQGQFDHYKPQLEYMAVYHELLTSSTRVNGIDPKSPVQDQLLEDFLRRFPDFQQNPYVQGMSEKYKLLINLITHKRRRALHAVMRLNDIVKRKNK